MGRGSGSIRPHLAVLLLLTGVLAGLLLRTPVPSVPTPLPQGEVSPPPFRRSCPLRRAFVESGPPWWGGWATSGAASRTRWGGMCAGAPAVVTAPGSSTSGEPAFRAGLLRLRILVRRQRRRRPRRLCRRGQRRAGPAGPVRPGGLGRRPGDLAFYPDLSHVGIVAGRGGRGLLVLHCSYALGAWCAPPTPRPRALPTWAALLV